MYSSFAVAASVVNVVVYVLCCQNDHIHLQVRVDMYFVGLFYTAGVYLCAILADWDLSRSLLRVQHYSLMILPFILEFTNEVKAVVGFFLLCQA